MKILFAASEAVPFCKTGGLGDVAGALTEALRLRRHDIRLVLPKYRSVAAVSSGLFRLPFTLSIPVGDKVHAVSVWEGRFGPGVVAYLIDSPAHFDRGGLYGSPNGKDYPDNDQRFILFSRAALEVARSAGFPPDVVHAHDWQAGLIPAYLKTVYRDDPFFARTSSVFSVHNIAYQGVFPRSTLRAAGFDEELFTPENLEYFGQVNFLKAGLVFADLISTVSPTYAEEVQSGEEYGRGMEGVLRSRAGDFVGVLNGIDTRLWNPSRDPLIAQRFSARSPAGRAACKRDLQRSVGLRPEPAAPLFGMVSRLDSQKGFDILLDILDDFIEDGAQAVFLGQGSPVYLAALRTLARKHPGRVAASSNFNEPLAHKIYAGADLFLMPSRFEPCGLGQMIALRYGAVPVVTPTGGLKDTVPPVSADGKAGAGFVAERTGTEAYRAALAAAVRRYRTEPRMWRSVVKRGMALVYDWKASAPKYVELYRRAIARNAGIPKGGRPIPQAGTAPGGGP